MSEAEEDWPAGDVEAEAAVPVPPLDPLSRLAVRYGTDKWGVHLYTPVYHRLFAPLRDRAVRLLEIGVGGYGSPVSGGASLRMWADYFPYGRVVGLDVVAKRLDLGPRISLVQGAQSDLPALARLWEEHGPFDIVIDDGSHLVGDVLTSFRALFPRLEPGGFYAVEDVQTAFWPLYGGNPGGRGTILSEIYDVMLAMHHREVSAIGKEPLITALGDLTASVQMHRNLAVFERGANTHPSNASCDATSPALRGVLGVLRAERVTAPSAGNWMIEATLLDIGGQPEASMMALRAGLVAFPDDPDLLEIGARVAAKLRLQAECAALLERLLALAPDDALLRDSVARQRRVAGLAA